MDAQTTEHVLSQVGRLLDAEVIYQNRKCGMAEFPPIIHHHKPPLVERPAPHTTSPPDLPWQPERTKMSITGLKSGKFQAMLAEMRREIEETQNQGVADVMAAKDQAAAEIKTTIAGVKDKIKSEVSDALQEFSEFTNGGPA